MWLPLALIAGLLAIGAAVGSLFSRNQGRLNETPTISRTAQVTSWSGLDFYPSISPDGNTVAFSSDRTGSFEIYVKQLVAGAREVQLTSDGGQNFEPAFSPDGSSLIAYHSQNRGGIWVVPLIGGTTKQLTEFGSRPAGLQIFTDCFQSDPLTDFGDSCAQRAAAFDHLAGVGKRRRAKQLTQSGNPLGGHGAPAWSWMDKESCLIRTISTILPSGLCSSRRRLKTNLSSKQDPIRCGLRA